MSLTLCYDLLSERLDHIIGMEIWETKRIPKKASFFSFSK